MSKIKFLLLAFLILISHVAFSHDSDNIQEKIDYYISQAKLDSAKTYIQNKLSNSKQKQEKSILNYQLVKVLFMQSAYNDALKQAFASLDDINNEQQRIKFNFMIGCIYSAIKDYNKSAEYFDLVIKHNHDSSLTVQTHLLLSQLHSESGDSVKAEKAITEAYKIAKHSDLDDKVKSHVAMQYNYINKNYGRCKELNFKIIRDSTSFLNAKSYAYSMIGDCLLKQDSLKEAGTYYDVFLKLTVETKDPEQIKVAANKLIELYEKLGNQEKANAYHKIYNEAVSDSLNFSVEKYRDLYNVEKNRELNIAQIKTRRNYLVAGLILLLILSVGIYYYLKSKKEEPKKTSDSKIVISESEIEKIIIAIEEIISKKLFLKSNITRKSVCSDYDIKSERYLSHYINEKYEKSFSVFINDFRIEYAHDRILKDEKLRNYKIEEIAKECGFGSKKSFERVFLAKYDETPFKFISSLSK